MPVIVVGAEKNFAALRPRVFSGRVTGDALREVTDAVAAANPHADLEKLEPGTVLTIPDHPRISTRGDLSLDDSTTKQVLEGISNAGAKALEQLMETARKTESEARAERKRLAKALDVKELDAAGRKDKALAAELKTAAEAVAGEEAAAKERAAALDEARAAWNSELKSLKSMLA
jgi:hypothetical protein